MSKLNETRMPTAKENWSQGLNNNLGQMTWDFSSFMPTDGDIVAGFNIHLGYGWFGVNAAWEGSLKNVLGWE